MFVSLITHQGLRSVLRRLYCGGQPVSSCQNERGLHMRNLLNRFAKDESGATAIEYGLIAALIAVVIIGAVGAIGTTLKTKFEAVKTGIETGK